MKHISLIALVVAFSVNSFAKDIFCASKDERILVLVSSQEQAISGMHHASSIQLQMSRDKGLLRKSEDVAGGIDTQTGKAFFISNLKLRSELDANKENDSTVQLKIGSYTDTDKALLQGTLTINDHVYGHSFDGGVYDMNCVTKFN